MRYIIAHVDSMQKYRFFDKLNRAIKAYSNEIIFVTIRLSVFLIGRILGRKVYLLKKKKNEFIDDNYENEEYYEVKSGLIDKYSASRIYYDSKNLFHLLNEKYLFKIAYIFNGLGVIDKALEDFVLELGINSKYFELSNIEGKIFVDNFGTNAKSSLYNDIEQLSHYDINMSHYIEWRKNYLNKLKIDSSMQQEIIAKKINSWYAIDLFGFWFLGVHQLSNKSIMEKIKTKLFLFRLSRKGLSNAEIIKPFILIPLQVSDDSQLLFHSSFNNIDLINTGHKIAKEKSMKLVVKIHPAEENIKFIQQVYLLKDELGFTLTNKNIYQLIESCELAVTINSSVGLLAKILEKEVIFIGNTFYEKLNSENLPTYVDCFLLNIDFWDNKYELREDELIRLLN
ncbi:MAG: hypothetical protein WC055_03515 [Melioribacteraceae bacterium]